MNAQHMSSRDDWMTPIPLLEKARHVLGSIDLDPASCRAANERVRAKRIITKEQDALTQPWCASGPLSVFANPPGGKRKNRSIPALFWQKLMLEHADGGISHAIFLCFSAESLQNTQGKGVPSVGEFTFCVPKRRIAFDCPDGVKRSPTHCNVIVYVPGTVDRTDLFRSTFADVGCVR